MKKEYKILLYAFPFIIALFAFATVLAPLFALVVVAFLVLYYYILQKSFSKLNIIKMPTNTRRLRLPMQINACRTPKRLRKKCEKKQRTVVLKNFVLLKIRSKIRESTPPSGLVLLNWNLSTNRNALLS